MIVRTYQAVDMREAIIKIKKDLGEDAIIVSTRKVKKRSIFSIFKREIIEVTAALDNKVKEQSTFKNIAKHHMNITKTESCNNKSSADKNLNERLKKIESLIVSLRQDSMNDVFNNIKSDISDLKNTLGYMKHESEFDVSKLPLGVHKYFKYMQDIGIDKKYAFKISVALYKNLDKEKLINEDYVKDYLSIVLSQFFKSYKPDKKGMILIGPTGVGKTTTIAKLAAAYKLKMNKNIGIITTDTYRIGAVDQLLTYAKIMDIPAAICVSGNDFITAMRDFEPMDNVFIDTVGRSQKDVKRLKELFNIFQDKKDLHVSLVMSLNVKETDSIDIYEKFSVLDIDSLIFTKLDETNTPGSMLNIAVKTKKPISYVSFGQDVPDDLMNAEPLKLSSLIIKKEVN